MNNVIFRRFSKDDATFYFDAMRKGIEQVTGACVVFSETAQRFNGKVLNKRFTDEVNARLLERFGVTEHEGWSGANVRVSLSDDGTRSRCFNVSLLNRSADFPRNNGYKSAVYFDSEICTKIVIGDAFMENGRIDADVFIDRARETADSCLRTYNEWRDALLNWDKYLAALDEIDAFIANKIGDINEMFLHSGACYFSNGHPARCDAKYSFDWYKAHDNAQK